MNKIQQQVAKLQSEFAGRAAIACSLFLLKPMNAVAHIDAGYGLGLTLTGVEGFIIFRERCVRPRQELSNGSADCQLSEEEFLESTKQLIFGVGERMNVGPRGRIRGQWCVTFAPAMKIISKAARTNQPMIVSRR